MNLMHLRYFCKLAETQHYTKAATELYISQPGLSGAIDSLESELGVSLFQKKGRNVALTKYGKEFYGYVREALRVLDTGIDAISVHTGTLNGVVRIASITTIDDSFLPMIVASFRNLYPQVTYRFFQGQTAQVLSGVEDDSFDIGFCSNTTAAAQPGINSIPVLNQPVMAVVHRDHPLSERSSIRLSELTEYQIYTYAETQPIGRQIHRMVDSLCPDFPSEKLHFDMHNEIFLAGLLTQYHFLSPDYHPVGLCVNAPYLEERQDLRVIPMEEVPEHFHQVCMVYKPAGFHCHAVTLFAEFVEQNFALEEPAGKEPQEKSPESNKSAS